MLATNSICVIFFQIDFVIKVQIDFVILQQHVAAQTESGQILQKSIWIYLAHLKLMIELEFRK